MNFRLEMVREMHLSKETQRLLQGYGISCCILRVRVPRNKEPALSHRLLIGDAEDAPVYERYIKKELYTQHSYIPYDRNISTHLSVRFEMSLISFS